MASLIATLAYGLLLFPFASEEQQPAKIPRVGFLVPSPALTLAAPDFWKPLEQRVTIPPEVLKRADQVFQ